MGFRRSPERIAAARRWQTFVEAHTEVIAASGLPPAATTTIEAWDDLLVHGFLVGDPGRFSVDQLAPVQYQSLVALASSYFEAGYEFYTPLALKPGDQDALRVRFQ